MKVQCSCGAKYAFDVTPEMAQQPLQLICQNCGTDISSFVNELIRQELAGAAAPAAQTPATATPSAAPLHLATAARPAAVPTAAAATEEWPVCLKHPPQRTTNKCRMCGKPICPECMALFGYVCSPLCRAKAEAGGIAIPAYAGQRANAEAREWAKISWIAAGVGLVLLGLLGWYGWYAFVGSKPHPVYSVRFQDRARFGESAIGADHQMIFLRNSTLARHDWQQKKEIWSRELSTAKGADAGYFPGSLGSRELRVVGRNVWVVTPEQLTRYDWDTGAPKQEIPLTNGPAILQADEVQFLTGTAGTLAIGHISLATGETRTEPVALAGKNSTARRISLAGTPGRGLETLAGLPQVHPGKNPGASFDPATIAAQVQSMSLPARIALPATLTNAWEEERLNAEMDGPRPAPPAGLTAPRVPPEDCSLIPLKDGCLEFSVQLVERNMVTRSALKAAPKKSALNGNVRASDSAAVANDLLNEMQRNRGGGTVTEDLSRYRVTLRRASGNDSAAWTDDVIGPPGVIPLESVNILVAGTNVYVFDESGKKLWQQSLTFPVPLGSYATGFASHSGGAGPCAEHNGVIFIADQGMLTAFERATGQVRWRLPSVGITGLFFDDAGMLYVNTTEASLDELRYSRQIDVTRKIKPVVTKIDPRNGKTLWSVKPGGFIQYVSGPYIYVVAAYGGDFDENGDSTYGVDTGLERAAYLRIKRLSPKNGSELWTAFQQRCPLDIQFNQKSMQLIFAKEVQVLRFLSL